MCNGCGKGFERKAALQSHSQICVKLSALLKETKDKPVETKDKPVKISKTVPTKPLKLLKGAAKRKFIVISPMIQGEPIKNPKKNDMAPDIEVIKETNDGITEIVTISDDSSDGGDVTTHPPELIGNDDIVLEKCSVIKKTNDKMTQDFQKFMMVTKQKVIIPPEYREILKDSDDEYFFNKAAPYMDVNNLTCLNCQTDYMSQHQLLWHMSLHFSWFRFQCCKCSFMSFNQYDCSNHASMKHGTPANLMGGTVLPIPKWKVLFHCHNFKQIDLDSLTNREPPIDDVIIRGKPSTNQDAAMPVLEPMDGAGMTSVICEDVIIEKSGGLKARKVGDSARNRPVRNRVKSVKTVQNDFIYDLGKVLKLNHESVGPKLKKTK